LAVCLPCGHHPLNGGVLPQGEVHITGQPGLAADLYAAIGSRPDEAYTRLEAARQHIATNRAVEANTELAVAFTFYREVGANAHLTEAKQLLATMLPSN
jgi:hypothetical protein